MAPFSFFRAFPKKARLDDRRADQREDFSKGT